MKRCKKSGFSLLEVIAAVIILAVVAAATVATVAPMRAKSEEKMDVQTKASLDAMSQTYFLENQAFPRSVNNLVTSGYLKNDTQAEQDYVRALSRKWKVDRNTGEWTER
ncbi:prepilin-type N-terminal cleavage/methylation domain-containing protein [Crateriforma conspicua]|uniref:Type II secretion system protein G n=1 Tax=Crateriforma conspicua TaxID=2527996 RepID=A0A5C6FNQ1_9PLAN|nr:prepilin-type N-terminal cleavage/methylation domain-containing protein [Crateriforma conspicua]TWU62842.1 hypothetical protein V7x_45780 [Crateriforma conspicua]